LKVPKKLNALNYQLRKGLVPLPAADNVKLANELSVIQSDLNSRRYTPSPPVGYLGVEKRLGVTRFVPVLSRRDNLVYYWTVLSLERYFLEKFVGVHGAYQQVPDALKQDDKIDLEKLFDLLDSFPYEMQNSIDPTKWFTQYRRFIDFIRDTLAQTPDHFLVATTDIANFYDSINIDKLAEKIPLRLAERHAPTQAFANADLLINYLRYWDRTVNGYRASSKGIPQEVISDASRSIANFYLQRFDDSFKTYCEENDLLYTRFADDLVIFGKSRKQLELSIHQASRTLVQDGLHLSAPKTKIYSKSEYSHYRALPVLDAIESANSFKIAGALKAVANSMDDGKPVRSDTILKRLLTVVDKAEIKLTSSVKEFIFSQTKTPEQISFLPQNYLVKRAFIENDPIQYLNKVQAEIGAKPFSYPKANFMFMLRKNRTKLSQTGLSDSEALSWIDSLDETSGTSDTIQSLCAPAAREFYSNQ